MKQFFAVLLCLLLCSCARPAPPALEETVPIPADVPVMAGLYDPAHPMEAEYPGLIRAYPLKLQDVQDILAFGKDVLILSGKDSTTMTLFTGEQLQEVASLTLDFSLKSEDPSLQILEKGISFYDPIKKATLVLDHRLQEIRQIAAPEEISGKPILSSDGITLYYCTGWSVTAWDLNTGIRRTLKELAYDGQQLTGLHLEDAILECTIRDKDTVTKHFLSSDRGVEIGTLPEAGVLHTGKNRYFAALPDGYQTLMIFGNTEDPAELLFPEKNWQQQFYLPEDHAAVTADTAEDGCRLNYYELSTGILRSSLMLPIPQVPQNIINCKGHASYILAYDPEADQRILYRWDVLRQTPDTSNTAIYKTDYHGIDDPDLEALEDCRKYAKTIGEKYGLRICIWEDAVQVQPWDYRFEPEYLAPVLRKELALLEQRLAQYPDNVLEQTKAHFTGLTICLVRSITGTGDGPGLSTATGIQFFHDNQAYVVITTGKYSQQAIYHELYHVMETHILTDSTALDSWESLNPSDFTYGQEQEIYLQGPTRAFVDRYSMHHLKEDRARILENAMLPGKQDVFQSEYMQRKLHAMCSGIREAYGLKKHPDPLPWEQYLVNPLVPIS